MKCCSRPRVRRPASTVLELQASKQQRSNIVTRREMEKVLVLISIAFAQLRRALRAPRCLTLAHFEPPPLWTL